MTNSMVSNNKKVLIRFREPYFLVGNMLLSSDNFIGKSFINQKSFEEKFLEDLPDGSQLEITPEAKKEIERHIQKNLIL